MKLLPWFATFTIFFLCVASAPENSQNKHRRIRAKEELEPEALMTVEEIIAYHGYPVSTHIVTTEDGYIIQIQRIPHGVEGPGSKPRQPVLIQHGALGSSACWVVNNKQQNLPYILADAGYDVWLGNFRGTSYGHNHTVLSPKNPKFWRFSFDQMGKYDIPAFVDTILNTTGYKQIIYIGHSLGSSSVFAMLATLPEYNDKIKGVLALGPGILLGNMKGAFGLLVPLAKSIDFLNQLIGFSGNFLENKQLVKIIRTAVCTAANKELCSNLMFLMSGYNLEQLNATRLPVITHHFPDSASVQTLFHIVQLADTGRYQYYDYGPKENKKEYGQIDVPQYNISRITAPIALFYGENDLMVDPTGINKLAHIIPNLILKYRVPDNKFSHTDFVWAIDGKKLLYDKMIETMKKLERN